MNTPEGSYILFWCPNYHVIVDKGGFQYTVWH
jgi:hypothetical protein